MNQQTKQNEQIDLGAGWRRVREDAVESGRALWLAGLGLVSTVDTNSREALDVLIARGEELETRERTVLSGFVRENRERARRLGREVEDRVEQGVTATLGRLGLPRRSEIQDLIGRIENLTTEVEALGATHGS